MVRVRFAPSPTGYLHVGGLRTALYNYLLARRTGGKFLLRIEDTDQTRLVEDAVDNILSALAWAGIRPDEGVGADGPFGPYVQSQRLDLYRRHAWQLVEAGHAYPCFCSGERLTAMREEMQKAGKDPMYDRLCRGLDPGQARRRCEAGERHVIRMKIPDDEVLVVEDLVRGRVEFRSNIVDDQVLMKSDGFPTYHLAAIVDDHLMEITHVIRGEEWLSSTPKHLLLYRYFGWTPPLFAHLPLIVNKEKKKLSKRDGDVSVEAYRDKGYTPEALVNFLALIGWGPGDDREFFTMPDLIEAFQVERVNKSAGVFDLDKLNHIQKLHLKALPGDDLVQRVLPWFDRAGMQRPDPAYLARVVELMRERATVLPDFASGVAYFYADPAEFDPRVTQKRWKETSGELLRTYADRLEALAEWNHDSLDGALRGLAEERGLGAGELIHPTRLALSGVGSGAGLFEMMEVLGKEVCLRRLRAAGERIAGQR